MMRAALMGGPRWWYALHHMGATRSGARGRRLRQQLPAQLGQPPPNRPIEDPLAHSDDSSAQDIRINGERGDHLLPQLPAQGILYRALQPVVGLPSQRNPRPHPVELLIQETEILGRDLPEQLLPTPLYQRLEKEHEFPGSTPETAAQNPRLLRFWNLGRHENRLHLRRLLHRRGHGVDQIEVPLGVAAVLSKLEQRLGVIPSDCL